MLNLYILNFSFFRIKNAKWLFSNTCTRSKQTLSTKSFKRIPNIWVTFVLSHFSDILCIFVVKTRSLLITCNAFRVEESVTRQANRRTESEILTSLLGTQSGVPSFTIPASTITPITIGSRELKMYWKREWRRPFWQENSTLQLKRDDSISLSYSFYVFDAKASKRMRSFHMYLR